MSRKATSAIALILGEPTGSTSNSLLRRNLYIELKTFVKKISFKAIGLKGTRFREAGNDHYFIKHVSIECLPRG